MHFCELHGWHRACLTLPSSCVCMAGMVAGLAAENAALRHQLALVQGQAQAPPIGAEPQQPLQQQQLAVPPPLPVPPPGMAIMPPPPGMPYMQWLPGMPYVGPTPKVCDNLIEQCKLSSSEADGLQHKDICIIPRSA